MFTQEFLNHLVETITPLIAAKLNAEATPKKRLLEASEAAIYIGRNENSIRCLESRGTISAVRKDGRVFFDIQDLDRWIESGK